MKKLFWSKWKVAKCGFPYKKGYGTYRKNWLTGDRVILDTGLTKEQAQYEADILNKKRE